MAEEIIKEAFQTERNAEDFVQQNGQYTNLILNDYKGQTGIKAGEYIRVQKHPQYNAAYTNERQATGKDGKSFTYNMHQAKVMVGDKEASFVTFNDDEARAFEDVAGLDDTIEISKKKYTYVDGRGKEQVKEELVFRKVE